MGAAAINTISKGHKPVTACVALASPHHLLRRKKMKQITRNGSWEEWVSQTMKDLSDCQRIMNKQIVKCFDEHEDRLKKLEEKQNDKS